VFFYLKTEGVRVGGDAGIFLFFIYGFFMFCLKLFHGDWGMIKGGRYCFKEKFPPLVIPEASQGYPGSRGAPQEHEC